MAALLAMFGKEPIWTKKDIANLARSGYEQCMAIYACVSMIAQGGATIPWILYKVPMSSAQRGPTRGRLEEMEEHALLDLIDRPNRYYGQFKFIEELLSFFLIAGNNYTIAIGPENGRPPKELWNLKPHRVKIIPGTKFEPIGGYAHYANPSNPDVYQPKDTLHLKCFAPLDDFYGLSPLEVAARGIDITNMGQIWNMRLLQNDMRPPGAFKILTKFRDDEERQAFKKNTMESFAGYQSAGRPLFMEGDVDWKPFAISPKDADWIQSDKLTLRRIAAVLHVSSILLGDTEAATYSNYQEARKALYMEGILPIMSFLRDELNNWLTPRYGDRLRLDYNRDAIEALQEDRNKLWERVNLAWWLTLNERREAIGYDVMGKEGDKIYIPISFIVLGEEAPENGGSADNKALILPFDNKTSFWQAPERKKALWMNFKARVTAKERLLIQISKRYLHDQADRVKKALEGVQYLSEVSAERLLDEEKEAERWVKTSRSWYVENFRRAGDAGMKVSKGELYDLEEKGTLFELDERLLRELEDIILNSGTDISKTTMEKILAGLKLADAENWTVEQFARELSSKLHDLSETRARLISRTESAKIENWGQLEGYKKTGYIELKGWLCSMVPDSRDSHIEADKRYSEHPIPLNEPFIVGGKQMQYPGDPAGGAKEVCNCLCSHFPAIRTG